MRTIDRQLTSCAMYTCSYKHDEAFDLVHEVAQHNSAMEKIQQEVDFLTACIH